MVSSRPRQQEDNQEGGERADNIQKKEGASLEPSRSLSLQKSNKSS